MLADKMSTGEYMLHTTPKKRYAINGPEIPIWGSMEIHLSATDAKNSLLAEEDDGAVRLVRVADFAQLKAMLVTGKEFLQPGANLYVRVAKTCPAFYARWESNDEDTHHEIWSEVSRNNTADDAKFLWFDAENNPKTPIKLNIYRVIPSSSSGQPVLVRTGAAAVQADYGEGGSDSSDGDGNSGSEGDGGGGSEASRDGGSAASGGSISDPGGEAFSEP